RSNAVVIYRGSSVDDGSRGGGTGTPGLPPLPAGLPAWPAMPAVPTTTGGANVAAQATAPPPAVAVQ
ncbi:Flp pilus assembly protein CpaB, partial [Burkholderia multivorans]|nr:Flp pilus assembly protein CpaB [Burkholderia multivorans]